MPSTKCPTTWFKNIGFFVLAAQQEVGRLSGGNIQKVVVAREFSSEPHLIVADQPTRGIDVGATEFIRKRLVTLRDEGCAVLLVSADLNEVHGIVGCAYRDVRRKNYRLYRRCLIHIGRRAWAVYAWAEETGCRRNPEGSPCLNRLNCLNSAESS